MSSTTSAKANPGPLGLFSFATTTLLISLYRTGARGLTNHDLVLGMGLSTGGLAQLLAGMWELALGHTLPGTAFTMYGAWWLADGLMHIPALDIASSYVGQDAEQLHNAKALLYAVWMIFSMLLTPAYMRGTINLFVIFLTLDTTWFLLMLGQLIESANVTKAAGWTGLICASLAAYEGTSELWIPEYSPLSLPRPMMPFAPHRPAVADPEAHVGDSHETLSSPPHIRVKAAHS